MQYFKSLFNRVFLIGLAFWISVTAFYFILVSNNLETAPIAADGLSDLFTTYIPVLFLAVFLLLFLTRKREAVNWIDLYAVNKATAKKEACISVLYLLIT